MTRLIIRLTCVVCFIMLACNGLYGCSHGKDNPLTPIEPADFPRWEENETVNHMLWGAWDIVFDLEHISATIEPIRDPQVHYNITDMLIPPVCNDCIEISVNSFNQYTRILDVDVTLRNPTQFTAHDVRGILYTNDYGHELRYADAWTGLFDIPGGKDINPFMAFVKDNWDERRPFKPAEEHTVNYLIYIPKPPNYYAVTFAVEASWPGNCKEPYAITQFKQEAIFENQGSTGYISVNKARDWQWDLDHVYLSAPEITGEEFVEFEYDFPFNLWRLELTNNMGVESGIYEARIIATSEGSGSLALYNVVNIVISMEPSEAVDITPPWLNQEPDDVCCTDDGYAYVASSSGTSAGLHIYDISNPVEPAWVNWVSYTPPKHDPLHIIVEAGYAYLTGGDGPVAIIDIDPPASAYLVTTVDMVKGGIELDTDGDYAYVVHYSEHLTVIDVNPVVSAYVLTTVEIDNNLEDVALQDDFVYTVNYKGLTIINVEQPNSPSIVGTLDIPGCPDAIATDENYAFITDMHGYFSIVDISQPDAAYVVNSLHPANYGSFDIAIREGYAIIVGNHEVSIVDIDPPMLAYVVESVETGPGTHGLDLLGEYAYVANRYVGLHIIDIDPPDSAYITGEIYTIHHLSKVVAVDGSYACVGDDDWGFSIFDISQPDSTRIITKIRLGHYKRGLAIASGYAYICTSYYNDDFYVIDITPPDDAHIAYSTCLPGTPQDLVVDGNYAYVATGYFLQIIDITNPESPNIANDVILPHSVRKMAIYSGYAYVVDQGFGLSIIDVDPPEFANVVNSIQIQGYTYDVAVDNGYAYVTDTDIGLSIIDVTTPESACIMNVLELTYARSIVLHLDYAICATSAGLQVIDISQPESAYIVNAIDATVYDLAVDDKYAYLVGWDYGFRIVELW